MFGRPFDSGDVFLLVILLIGLPIVAFARFGRILKPAAGPPLGPSPETVARVTRNIRTSMTFSGANLCILAVMGLSMHRVPQWLWWSFEGIQIAVLAAFLVHLIRNRRERSRA